MQHNLDLEHNFLLFLSLGQKTKDLTKFFVWWKLKKNKVKDLGKWSISYSLNLAKNSWAKQNLRYLDAKLRSTLFASLSHFSGQLTGHKSSFKKSRYLFKDKYNFQTYGSINDQTQLNSPSCLHFYLVSILRSRWRIFSGRVMAYHNVSINTI